MSVELGQHDDRMSLRHAVVIWLAGGALGWGLVAALLLLLAT